MLKVFLLFYLTNIYWGWLYVKCCAKYWPMKPREGRGQTGTVSSLSKVPNNAGESKKESKPLSVEKPQISELELERMI